MFLFLTFVFIILFLIFFNNKKNFFCALFFGLFAVLPSFFGLEFSQSLPILTASRFLIILCICYFFATEKIVFSFKKTQFYYPLLFYFVSLLIVNFLNLIFNDSGINSIFTLIFEDFVLVYIFSKMIHTKKNISECLIFFSNVALIIFILTLIEGITGFHWANLLKTVDRDMVQASQQRLGFERVVGTFGISVCFVVYLNMCLPINFYLYEQKQSITNYIKVILNIICILLTGARGGIIATLVFLVCYFLLKRKIVLKKYKFIFISSFALIVFLAILKPSVFDSIIGLFKSIANVFGANYEIDEFGTNINGLESRTNQLTGIIYTLDNSPLIGFGADANVRGLIKFCRDGIWFKTNTYDMAFVQIFCDYGLIGFIAYMLMFIFVLAFSFKKSQFSDKNNMHNIFFFIFFIYFLCLFSVVVNNNLFFLFLGLYIAYVSLERKEYDKKTNL